MFRKILIISIFLITYGNYYNFAQNVEKDFFKKLVTAAVERTKHNVVYDGSYRSIKYPLGDVPDSIGVCTDLVIRAYRVVKIDLQKLVHEDMVKNFIVYPKVWGLKKPDTNIDHRRVLNLRTFFSRKGKVLTISKNPNDYKIGDIITWTLPSGCQHIGIVTDRYSKGTKIPLIVHNIGEGPVIENVLFKYKINGHFRFPAQ